MIWWKRKSILVVSLGLFIAVLVWSQMALYLVYQLFGVNVEKNFFNFCLSLFEEYNTIQFLIHIFLNLSIIYTILITIFKIGEQYIQLKRFKSKIFQLKDEVFTNIFNKKYHRFKQDILVINHNQLWAFTFGFRKSYIVLTTSLIDILDDNELEAVIEHETSHQLNHDALKSFILRLISQTLWFIPMTKWVYQNYKIICELLADQYAIQKMNSQLGLSTALLKLIKNNFHESYSHSLVHFSDESVNFRIGQLVSPHREIPVKLQTKSFMISIQVMLLMTVMILVTVS
jgi:beta-lactamase regulating signal transducer with metallopeptidase domain